MVERPVITETFESISVDIVGPLPKGKGGAEYILTIWPPSLVVFFCSFTMYALDISSPKMKSLH